MSDDLLQDSPTLSLPHNLQVERALLGSLILDNRQIDLVLEIFHPEAVSMARQGNAARRRGQNHLEPLFFSQAHQRVFGSICRLYDAGTGIDLTTLAEELNRQGDLELVGGAPYLASLEDDVFSLTQVPEYARIIMEKWKLRSLIRATQLISEVAASSDARADEVIEQAEKRIFEIALDRVQRDFVQIGEPLAEQLIEIENRKKGVAELPGLPTGFRVLDRMTTGLRPSQLIILAARPSMGKTALALNIAAHVAFRRGQTVGIFSLEMSASELITRLMCTEARVSMGRVRGNFGLRRDELDAIHEAAERIEKAPLYIDDASSLSAMELRAKARRLKSRCPELALIIVDYLQLMTGGGARYDNRQQEVSEISRSLKQIARELNIPVIALSQLSRQSEQRQGRGVKDKLPRLSDLRESGAIEQDADIVLFIHRERNMATDEDGSHEPELATLRIGKQRNGPIGDTQLLFRGEFTRFVDLALDSD
ncbi:MAG TPA: replicative DNA helicase [Candidatus Sumerlaeota bacterium]|nr:replicative DNA helicase [Candidatus Sumerlaeota bacterium]